MKEKVIVLLLLVFGLNHEIGIAGNDPSSARKAKVSAFAGSSGQSLDIRYLPNTLIVKFKSEIRYALGKTSVDEPSLNFVFRKYGVNVTQRIFPNHDKPPTLSDQVDLSRIYEIRYYGNDDPLQVAKEFAKEPVVEYAEPYYTHRLAFVPNDPGYTTGLQWYLKTIQSEAAWEISQGDTNVVIGMVDTGVDWTHEDLAANIWTNPRPGSDPNFPNDIRGWDFGGLNGTPDNDPNEDRPDHGTGTAGVASAVTNNGIGIAGIGFKCKIMPVKVSQDNSRDINGSPYIIHGYKAIVYAADKGASIINCSWGGGGYSQYEQDVVNYANQKGALIVAAAGNDNSSVMFTPAGYDHVLAVAATDSRDRRSVWLSGQASNYGEWIDVSAPGSNMYITWKGNQYTFLAGTSFSSPLAAGVAALVKSAHPTWTPDQIAEQVRVSCDKIDTVNPGFTGKLGFGRINAYRALTVVSPAVRVASFTVSDSLGGNNDGAIDPGETIQITFRFKNYLAPTTNATIGITCSDTSVVILGGSVLQLGNLSTLQETDNKTNPLTVRISGSVPENHSIVFTVSVSDGNYSDGGNIRILAHPTFQNHETDILTMTMTSRGTFGFNDYPVNLEGSGFRYKDKLKNILFEGSLMFGVSSNRVSNSARDKTGDQQNTDFLALQPFKLKSPTTTSDQEGTSIFNDDGADTSKIGVRVTLRSYSFGNPPNDSYVLLRYFLENTTAAEISNLYAGLFLDWDIGPNGENNEANYDGTNRLGYVWNVKRDVSTFGGVSLMSTNAPVGYWAIDNDENIRGAPWGIYDGFTVAEKWQSLSSGIGRAKTDTAGDVSHVLSTGPLTIQPGQKIEVGFAVLGGDTLPELQANVQSALNKWKQITFAEDTNTLPKSFVLYQNYPNPFNPTTNILYDLPSDNFVSLKVYNVLGQEIATLVSGNQKAGKHTQQFEAKMLATGVYFYRLQVGDFSEVKKMLVIR
jgi:subtilisin family serine protease